jgi:hypothetical protein
MKSTRIGGMPRRWSLVALLAAAGLACGGDPPNSLPSPPPPPGPPPGPPPVLPPPPPPGEITATVTLNPGVTYQTMRGWEATSQAGQANPAFASWKSTLMDLAVNDLGINRIRLEVRSGSEHPTDNYAAFRSGAISEATWRTLRYSIENDNANPAVTNAGGFHFTELDQSVEAIILPMRQLLAARGERLHVVLNYVSFGSDRDHEAPAEYAEFIAVVFQHLQDKYGFVPDGVEVILEPDNATIWRGPSIGAAIAATGARLQSMGHTVDFVAPSTTSMANAVPYFDQIVAVPGATTYLKELSYHRYTGVSDANLSAIRARGAQYGVTTGMLEHIGSGVDDLYKDLTLANAGAWQQFTLAVPVADNGAQYYLIQNNQPVLASRSVQLRQYFRYVRFGATRVGATSDVSRVRPVGFLNVGGGAVVVMHLDQPEALSIVGLPAGRYGISSSAANGVELGEITISSGSPLYFTAATSGLFTVYRKP